ncbi:MAG: PLP-dependent aminotransferase family protein [Rhodocyclaceae bacterium]|nr:PLP-dependent aminotransferase family protein [Rhodocyclaceae bacterium]MDP2196397.1 PLP-dependent aminotransferase family protein [Rhodocyclaceae bacterium]
MSELRYEKLADNVAGLIASGILRAGERLPSVRRLAQERRVSISTAVQAFRQLEMRGLVEARPQSGFFVRARPQAMVASAGRGAPEAPVAVDLNQRLVRVLQAITRPGIVPLGAAFPAPSLLPVAALHRRYASVARRFPGLLAGGSHADMNDPQLVRQIVRNSLGWGGPLDPDEIIVTNSCTEAMSLCLRAATRPGDTVAVESPAYFVMLQLIESLGLKALEIPTDPVTGLSVAALDLATRDGKVAAVLLAPNANNPLGSVMPDEGKRKLAELMAARNVPVIEDDIYGDLCFGTQRPWPLKAFDSAGNVMLCASFSKCLSPALRIGFVAAGKFRTAVALQRTLSSGGTNPITQRVLAEMFESGAYERQARVLRRQFQKQVEQMMAAVARYFPAGTRVARPQGGLVLWVELPEASDTAQLFPRAIAEGIAFVPGELFSASGLYHNCLRLNCGNPWSAAIEAAVRRLGELAGSS